MCLKCVIQQSKSAVRENETDVDHKIMSNSSSQTQYGLKIPRQYESSHTQRCYKLPSGVTAAGTETGLQMKSETQLDFLCGKSAHSNVTLDCDLMDYSPRLLECFHHIYALL